MQRHNIVVMGASAVGVWGLGHLVQGLPADLPAAAIEPGRIYVAPPHRHLLVKPEYMRVVFGLKENGFRPAIDSLRQNTGDTSHELGAQRQEGILFILHFA
jgi:two-component system chemotaxis response regulator CheB